VSISLITQKSLQCKLFYKKNIHISFSFEEMSLLGR